LRPLLFLLFSIAICVIICAVNGCLECCSGYGYLISKYVQLPPPVDIPELLPERPPVPAALAALIGPLPPVLRSPDGQGASRLGLDGEVASRDIPATASGAAGPASEAGATDSAARCATGDLNAAIARPLPAPARPNPPVPRLAAPPSAPPAASRHAASCRAESRCRAEGSSNAQTSSGAESSSKAESSCRAETRCRADTEMTFDGTKRTRSLQPGELPPLPTGQPPPHWPSTGLGVLPELPPGQPRRPDSPAAGELSGVPQLPQGTPPRLPPPGSSALHFASLPILPDGLPPARAAARHAWSDGSGAPWALSPPGAARSPNLSPSPAGLLTLPCVPSYAPPGARGHAFGELGDPFPPLEPAGSQRAVEVRPPPRRRAREEGEAEGVVGSGGEGALRWQ
jgi:hypothetical protein